MNPVLILQNLSGDGPAHLGRWLSDRDIAFETRDSEAGDPFPASMAGYGGLAILGGEMSANDDLPSLRRAEALFLQAHAMGVPTLGHCLGGQLMARALGARVAASPAPELGWQPMFVADHESAHAWFGPAAGHVVFQWHREAFDLPAGALRLASSAACPVQAFSIGPHLAMQFHLEIDEEKLVRWSLEEGAFHDADRGRPTVQGGLAMRRDMARHLSMHQALADRVYTRWVELARQRDRA